MDQNLSPAEDHIIFGKIYRICCRSTDEHHAAYQHPTNNQVIKWMKPCDLEEQITSSNPLSDCHVAI